MRWRTAAAKFRRRRRRLSCCILYIGCGYHSKRGSTRRIRRSSE